MSESVLGMGEKLVALHGHLNNASRYLLMAGTAVREMSATINDLEATIKEQQAALNQLCDDKKVAIAELKAENNSLKTAAELWAGVVEFVGKKTGEDKSIHLWAHDSGLISTIHDKGKTE